MKKITISDVALHAGVSITTVSMVLSNKGRISENTAEKVNHSIAELGYIRNKTAANLRANQSEIIGLILHDISEPFYAQVAGGFCDEAESQGLMVFVRQCKDDEKLKEAFQAMTHQGVGGIAFCPSSESQSINYEFIQQQKIPKVCISRASIHHQLDNVCPDNAIAAKTITKQLIELGHKRIAYIGGRTNSLRRAERVGGYCSTLMQHGLPFDSNWVIECEKGQMPAAKAVKALLENHPQISGILCHDAVTLQGVIHGVLKKGRTLGQDIIFDKNIHVSGFDVFQASDNLIYSVTSINSNANEIGRQSAKRLIEQMQNSDEQPRKIIVPPNLVNAV